MRLVKKGTAWSATGGEGCWLGRDTHLAGYLPDEGTTGTRLSLFTEGAQVESRVKGHAGICLQGRKVHVTFLEEVRA